MSNGLFSELLSFCIFEKGACWHTEYPLLWFPGSSSKLPAALVLPVLALAFAATLGFAELSKMRVEAERPSGPGKCVWTPGNIPWVLEISFLELRPRSRCQPFTKPNAGCKEKRYIVFTLPDLLWASHLNQLARHEGGEGWHGAESNSEHLGSTKLAVAPVAVASYLSGPITCRHNWTHLALVVARCLAKRFEPRPSDLQTAPCWRRGHGRHG